MFDHFSYFYLRLYHCVVPASRLFTSTVNRVLLYGRCLQVVSCERFGVFFVIYPVIERLLRMSTVSNVGRQMSNDGEVLR